MGDQQMGVLEMLRLRAWMMSGMRDPLRMGRISLWRNGTTASLAFDVKVLQDWRQAAAILGVGDQTG